MSETDTALASAVHAEPLADGALLRLHLAAGRGNVLTAAVMEELRRAVERAADDPALRLVLLTAEGPHFSYGASIAEHRREAAPALLATFHGLIRAIAGSPVPVAALVRGQCLGAGFEVVLACHLVFATESARFGCPEIKLGVFPPVLAAFGPARLGWARAERLLLTGDSFDAAEAQAWGLLAAPPVDDDEALAAIVAWARQRLVPLSALALRAGTTALRATGGALADLEAALAEAERRYLAEILPSADGNEGIAAYLERRAPRWSHR